MRALLVVNPNATTTGRRTRDALARALSAELKLKVVETAHRGHATELARQAAVEGLDLVVALGGDGTANEVANGLLADGPAPSLPAVAVIPGGSTNVFARSLGMPNDPVRATGVLLDALRCGRSRQVGLGMADERWFLFNAGLGFDADVVRRVEEARASGRRATNSLYVRTALRTFFTEPGARRGGSMQLSVDGAEPTAGLCLAIVQNTAPYSYVGRRPVHPSPGASFDGGLDLFGLTSMPALGTLRHLGRMLAPRPAVTAGRHAVTLHNRESFTITAEEPSSLQVDGDHLGRRRSVTFRSVSRALRVIV
jgi:diacylglycerol kinase family enzyme